jgi:hypothetical protein
MDILVKDLSGIRPDLADWDNPENEPAKLAAVGSIEP